jgi:hypothetical protein
VFEAVAIRAQRRDVLCGVIRVVAVAVMGVELGAMDREKPTSLASIRKVPAIAMSRDVAS